MKQNKKRALFYVLLFVLGVVFGLTKINGQAEDGYLLKADEKGNDDLIYDYPLEKDQTIEVTEGEFHNVIRIQDGQAYMQEADCPDGYCKEQGRISGQKQTIVCLPHKLVVEVIRQNDTENKAAEDDLVPDTIAK